MANVPASIEAEEALLGSILLYPQTQRLVYDEGLTVSEFFDGKHRKIYDAILSLNQQQKPIDAQSVITRLSDTQTLDMVGGTEYIFHLTDVAISSTNSAYYLSTIKEKALLRKLIEVCENIKDKCYQQQYSPLDVLNEAESKITEVSRERKTTEFISGKQAIKQVIDRINQLQNTKDLTGIASGFKYIDKITNGFQNGDLIIVAARPSVGKTAFALNVASNVATVSGKKVAIFSLEMPAIHLGSRMLSAKASVDSEKIRTGKNITNQEWVNIDRAINAFSNSSIYMDDSSVIKVNDIFAKCRKLKENEGLDLIIIDYLQLIAPSTSRGDNRQQEVSDISRALKQLARELNVPVMALSQLSRSAEKGGGEKGKTPVLSDLRESGAIEQDADVVMFLHRDKAANENEDGTRKETQEIRVIIAKHRNGALGSVDLAFQSKFNRFLNKEKVEGEDE
ncbi:MAG: replicative DNA helicase [Erysipelotrichaceae bacterium]